MISRLPPWVEYGAFILAFVAGCINAIGLLGVEHQAISHLSGTATLVGAGMIAASWQSSAHLLAILLSFMFGASLSGFLLHGSALRLGRNYDLALLVEALLIFFAFYLLSRGMVQGHYLASAACGVQNALATTYSGAIIRTTHVTGIFTDLGLMLGEVLRGKDFDKRKALLFVLIIAGFVTGAAAGAALFATWHFFALLLPATMCLALALLYFIYNKRVEA